MTNAGASRLPKIPQPLGDFGPAYFDHVLAEFKLLSPDGKLSEKVQEIIETHEKEAKEGKPVVFRWGDLYLLEKYVICHQSEDVLRARLPGLRLSYRGIVGAEAYEQYLQSRQAAPPNGKIEELRADAGRLLDALHWAYAMAPERERTRISILKSITWEMLISSVIGAAILFSAFYLGQTLAATIVLVVFMGALGGFLSVQQRIEQIPTEQDPILTMFQLWSGRFAVRLAPLTGAMCALILFLVFQAGLLEGALFPDMSALQLWLGKGLMPGGGIIDSTKATEYAKLLVWCFIAGFAERLVPDTLNNLIARREEAAVAKAPSLVPLPKTEEGDQRGQGGGGGGDQKGPQSKETKGTVVTMPKPEQGGAAAPAAKEEPAATVSAEQKGPGNNTPEEVKSTEHPEDLAK